MASVQKTTVIPAYAGIQSPGRRRLWLRIPAFAGMTDEGDDGLRDRHDHFLTWLLMCLFISNIEALSLPKIFFSLSSARISRLLAGFWRLFFLM